MMDYEMVNCPVCNSNNTKVYYPETRDTRIYVCPVCGKFELDHNSSDGINKNHLASYLFYHAYSDENGGWYHTELSEEACTEIRSASKGKRHPIHMDAQIVDNWYPHTFSEKTDKILLFLGEHEKHFGEIQKYGLTPLKAMLFIDLQETDSEKKYKWRHDTNTINDARRVLSILKQTNMIFYQEHPMGLVDIALEPEGYKRIDELQRSMSVGNDVLVAMEFGDKTKAVREAIRKGIINAGFNPIIYDEVENNDFIMPELLKSIRDCKFVVADLSDYNNGAYFEEGYAMGLGKAVIQVCKKGTELHFDAAQKNTIVFETEEELTTKLTRRIRATIS